MKIIVLGAGQVGGTLAEHLVAEENDITVVDQDTERLQALQSRLDIRTVTGYASHPDVLKKAGGDNADMIIAVTNSDETNIVACQLAAHLFQTPTKVARVRADNYFKPETVFSNDCFPIDICISPEQLVTDHIYRLITCPGASEVLEFADGAVQLLAIKPFAGGLLVGRRLSDLKDIIKATSAHLVASFRGERALVLDEETIIAVGDTLYFMAAPKQLPVLLQGLGRAISPFKRIMISGGGRIGHRIASTLESSFDVKIIEQNAKRAEMISGSLHKTVVLLGSGVDSELLQSENIENVDVFCAVTNDDEANIISSLQAKKLGAHYTIALMNRTDYTDLIEGGRIDIALCPQEVTIGSILARLRQGDVTRVHVLRHGEMEALEVIVHGDESTSQVVGRQLCDINLPESAVVGALVRDGELFVPEDDLVVQANDHLILLVMNKQHIHDVEQLFQVSFNFIY